MDIPFYKDIITAQDDSEELREINKVTTEMPTTEDTSDVLRSDGSDFETVTSVTGTETKVPVTDTSSVNDRKGSYSVDDDEYDIGKKYGHRRLKKRHFEEPTVSLQRCEVGSVWEINCFSCFCGIDGQPRCDKIARCTLLSYGKR